MRKSCCCIVGQRLNTVNRCINKRAVVFPFPLFFVFWFPLRRLHSLDFGRAMQMQPNSTSSRLTLKQSPVVIPLPPAPQKRPRSPPLSLFQYDEEDLDVDHENSFNQSDTASSFKLQETSAVRSHSVTQPINDFALTPAQIRYHHLKLSRRPPQRRPRPSIPVNPLIFSTSNSQPDNIAQSVPYNPLSPKTLWRQLADAAQELQRQPRPDLRFVPAQRPLDRLQDLRASIAITLFSDGYVRHDWTLSPDSIAPESPGPATSSGRLITSSKPRASIAALCRLPYERNSKDFLRCLDLGIIPHPEDLPDANQCYYYDGCLIAEITDLRALTLKTEGSMRVLLRPHMASLYEDLEKLTEDVSPDIALLAEQKIIDLISPSVVTNPFPCLAPLRGANDRSTIHATNIIRVPKRRRVERGRVRVNSLGATRDESTRTAAWLIISAADRQQKMCQNTALNLRLDSGITQPRVDNSAVASKGMSSFLLSRSEAPSSTKSNAPKGSPKLKGVIALQNNKGNSRRISMPPPDLLKIPSKTAEEGHEAANNSSDNRGSFPASGNHPQQMSAPFRLRVLRLIQPDRSLVPSFKAAQAAVSSGCENAKERHAALRSSIAAASNKGGRPVYHAELQRQIDGNFDVMFVRGLFGDKQRDQFRVPVGHEEEGNAVITQFRKTAEGEGYICIYDLSASQVNLFQQQQRLQLQQQELQQQQQQQQQQQSRQHLREQQAHLQAQQPVSHQQSHPLPQQQIHPLFQMQPQDNSHKLQRQLTNPEDFFQLSQQSHQDHLHNQPQQFQSSQQLRTPPPPQQSSQQNTPSQSQLPPHLNPQSQPLTGHVRKTVQQKSPSESHRQAQISTQKSPQQPFGHSTPPAQMQQQQQMRLNAQQQHMRLNAQHGVNIQQQQLAQARVQAHFQNQLQNDIRAGMGTGSLEQLRVGAIGNKGQARNGGHVTQGHDLSTVAQNQNPAQLQMSQQHQKGKGLVNHGRKTPFQQVQQQQRRQQLNLGSISAQALAQLQNSGAMGSLPVGGAAHPSQQELFQQHLVASQHLRQQQQDSMARRQLQQQLQRHDKGNNGGNNNNGVNLHGSNGNMLLNGGATGHGLGLQGSVSSGSLGGTNLSGNAPLGRMTNGSVGHDGNAVISSMGLMAPLANLGNLSVVGLGNGMTTNVLNQHPNVAQHFQQQQQQQQSTMLNSSQLRLSDSYQNQRNMMISASVGDGNGGNGPRFTSNVTAASLNAMTLQQQQALADAIRGSEADIVGSLGSAASNVLGLNTGIGGGSSGIANTDTLGHSRLPAQFKTQSENVESSRGRQR